MTNESQHEQNKRGGLPESHDMNLAFPLRYAVLDSTHPQVESSERWPGYYSPGTEMEFFAPIAESAEYLADATERWVARGYGGRLGYDRSIYVDRYKPAALEWRALMLHDVSRHPAPVFAGEPWFTKHIEIWRDHFLSVSESDPSLLSYVQTPEKGIRGIRTPIKPGRYLAKFFGGVLSVKQIADMARWQETGQKESAYSDESVYPTAYASTPDGIERAYLDGPESCMSHPAEDYETEGVHPVQVYGAGDLMLAYLRNPYLGEGDENSVLCRALVWPEKKAIGRIYPGDYEDQGTPAYELARRFRALGYTSLYTDGTLFDGARLLKIKVRRGVYVMPYVDVHRGVEDSGDCFRIKKHGPIYADDTEGTQRIAPLVMCGQCGEEIERGGEGEYGEYGESYEVATRWNASGDRVVCYQTWCQTCHDTDTFYCEGCEASCSTHHVQAVEIDGFNYNSIYVSNSYLYSEYTETYRLRANTPDGEAGRAWDMVTVCEPSGAQWGTHSIGAILNRAYEPPLETAFRDEIPEGYEQNHKGTWFPRGFLATCARTGIRFAPTRYTIVYSKDHTLTDVYMPPGGVITSELIAFAREILFAGWPKPQGELTLTAAE